MPDYANVPVKVVVILGMIKRVPATTSANNVFCYYAVAHIVTPLVNLAFRPKLGFKNKCRTPAGFRLVISGSGFKMRPFYNSVWVCRQGPTSGNERYILHPPTVKIG